MICLLSSLILFHHLFGFNCLVSIVAFLNDIAPLFIFHPSSLTTGLSVLFRNLSVFSHNPSVLFYNLPACFQISSFSSCLSPQFLRLWKSTLVFSRALSLTQICLCCLVLDLSLVVICEPRSQKSLSVFWPCCSDGALLFFNDERGQVACSRYIN